MQYSAPFLALPDYRTGLFCELLLGVPVSSPVSDTSGNSNPGTIVNATRITDPVTGKKVLNFTPANAEVTIVETPAFNFDKNSGSVCFWVKPKAAENIFFAKNGSELTFNLLYSTKHQLRVYSAESGAELWGPNDVALNEWVMFTYVKDYPNTKLYLYQNEKLLTSKNEGRGYGTHAMQIGTSGAESHDFDMAMYRHYSGVLTAIEIKQIYQFTRRSILSMAPIP